MPQNSGGSTEATLARVEKRLAALPSEKRAAAVLALPERADLLKLRDRVQAVLAVTDDERAQVVLPDWTAQFDADEDKVTAEVGTATTVYHEGLKDEFRYSGRFTKGDGVEFARRAKRALVNRVTQQATEAAVSARITAQLNKEVA